MRALSASRAFLAAAVLGSIAFAASANAEQLSVNYTKIQFTNLGPGGGYSPPRARKDFAAAPVTAGAEREHINFTYQKIIWSTETAKSSSAWIRNGQPYTSPPPGDALADLPQAPSGRIPPHTPEIKLNRGASPSGPGFPRHFESTAKNDPTPSVPPQFKARLSGVR